MFVLVIPFFLILAEYVLNIASIYFVVKSSKYQKTYWSLTYIMPLVFFIPPENRKSDIFYMFSGDIGGDLWYYVG